MSLQDEMLQAADEIFDLIGQKSASDYFIEGGERPVALKVTSRSGQLREAVLGGVNGIETTTFESDRMVMTKGVRLPYAALIHDGGVRVVTDAMRRFFWAKYLERRGTAEGKMWSILRFKSIIKYQPRKFLENAINDLMTEIPEVLRKHALEGLRLEIKKIIEGSVRAVPLNATK